MLRPILSLILGLLTFTSSLGQGLSAEERRIVELIDSQVDEAISLLETTVNINSGTMNHEGVRSVGRIFAREFDKIGFETSWEELPDSLNRAGHLWAKRRGDTGKRVLIIGHLDTVFEADSPFQQYERLDDSTAVGPGVEDMKGGDVVALFALKALHEVGALDDAFITVAYLGDEEFAGRPLPVSRRSLMEAGREHDVALGFEGMARGKAVIARRGYTGWHLHVSGKRAHSSVVFSESVGAGAIYEAARILRGFYADIRGEEYLTFGPGIILGGTRVTYDKQHSSGTAFGKANVVPQTVVVEGDLRAISPEQVARTKERMRAIVDASLPNTSAEIVFDDSFPPMAPTQDNIDLLRRLSQVSQDLGFGPVEADDPLQRGAADVSFVADGIPAIDGLGTAGSGGHTVSEKVDLRSVPLAIKQTAVLIYRLTR
ncbi:MAG: M20/M25/M40 family metallo-hydrolase [Rhodothermales bacterium]|nr:M20/M25/M40 family metallo-hydrolase [Rhodothermales bacterium]